MNTYIEKIKPYQVAPHDIWNYRMEEAVQCLKLDWNESTIPPSPKVRERLMELAGNPYFYHWYPNTHNQKLLAAIGNYVGVGKENIQVFSSSDILHEYIAKTWLLPDDKVIIMWPTYDNFRVAVESIGAKVLYYELENFTFDAGKINDLIKNSAPKMVYLCNPNNPTGEAIGTECLKRIIQENKNCMFVLDEAYVEYYGKSLAVVASKTENLLVTRTFSKAFGLANFRIGYLVSTVNNINTISKIRNSKSISTFAQEAAIAALDDLPYMQEYVNEVIEARRQFVTGIFMLNKNIRIYPSQANFVLMSFKDDVARDMFVEFMKRKKIFIRKLYQSDKLSGSVRVTIGTIEQMQYVFEQVKEFVRDYESCVI